MWKCERKSSILAGSIVTVTVRMKAALGAWSAILGGRKCERGGKVTGT